MHLLRRTLVLQQFYSAIVAVACPERRVLFAIEHIRIYCTAALLLRYRYLIFSYAEKYTVARSGIVPGPVPIYLSIPIFNLALTISNKQPINSLLSHFWLNVPKHYLCASLKTA